MKKALILAVAITALVFAGSSVNDAVHVPAPEAKPQNSRAAAPAFDPSLMMFDFAPGSEEAHEPQLLQRRTTLPAGWEPDPPLNLAGPMPSDDDVRAAIVQGVNFLLDSQTERGSWDVELTGTLLSETADQAFDSIAATSLAGIALRYHYAADPARIEPALKKAVGFVIDRVYRGKLPLQVWYANWRYTLGLKFLHGEYLLSTDEELRGEIRAVSRRMINAMLKLQLSNNEASLLDKKRRQRISHRYRSTAMPSGLGVVMRPPTDAEYRGGAPIDRILPGSTAEDAGLKVGDRIVEAEGLRVENALDFYLEEAQWMAGQKVRLKIRRDGGGEFTRDIQIKPTWPAYLGVRLSAGIGEGPVVESFQPFSPARGQLEIGDVIQEIGGTEIKTVDDYEKAVSELTPGRRVRVRYKRGDSRRAQAKTFEAIAAPEGWFGFWIEEDDKGMENGVVTLERTLPNSAARKLDLKGGDRVTWIGDTPIIGYDHFAEFLGTVPAGRNFEIKWIRDGAEMSGTVMADPVPQPFDAKFGITIDREFRAMCSNVERGGPAERAGMKPGDVFTAVNGNPTPNFFDFRVQVFSLTAGETVTWTVLRGGNQTVEIKYELPRANFEEEETEEGGWAYYPEMGESPSFSTAAAMLVLLDVQNDLDIRGLRTTLRGPLRSAANLMHTLRARDATHGGAETYLYREGSRQHPNNIGIDIRGCQGRNTICDLALVRHGTRRKADLVRMIDQFIRYRGELDAVRRMEYYVNQGRGSPHNFDRWNNAAYYWMFGHYYTLVAAKEASRRHYRDVNEICVKALMATRLDDGTWLDHPSFGKHCGTSLALWILGETEGGWREGYNTESPVTQEKKPEAKEENEEKEEEKPKKPDWDDILE